MSIAVSVMIPAAVTSSIEEITAFARHVEGQGLSGVFTGDHLTGPGAGLDSTLVLALAAAAAPELTVGFGVMQVALRHPVWAAKQVATLQHLTGGRVILGVGVGGGDPTGWLALDLDPHLRGRLTDHALAVLPTLIAGQPTHLGAAGSVTLTPAASAPPILVGGNTPRARRRVAEHRTGWFPSMISPRDLAAGISDIHHRSASPGSEDLATEPAVAVGAAVLLGHPPDAPSATTWTATAARNYGIDTAAARDFLITGDTTAAADAIARYRDAGAQHLVLGLIDPDWRAQCELIADATRALT